MNKLLTLLIVSFLLLTQCNKFSGSETILIPDESFLNALIDLGIDPNGDGQISIREADAVLTIRIWPSNITDLTGIEHFQHLDTLSIIMNPLSVIDLTQNKSLRYLELNSCELTELDLSGNMELTHLDCSSGLAMKNYLTELDLSANPKLEYLSCVENQLTSINISSNSKLNTLRCGYNYIPGLDVSSNTQLTTLHCNNNLLASLDVSENVALTNMITCGNKFSIFDISKNANLTKIGIDNMPELHQVCVWTLPFPPAGIVMLMGFSPNVVFTMDCQE